MQLRIRYNLNTANSQFSKYQSTYAAVIYVLFIIFICGQAAFAKDRSFQTVKSMKEQYFNDLKIQLRNLPKVKEFYETGDIDSSVKLLEEIPFEEMQALAMDLGRWAEKELNNPKSKHRDLANRMFLLYKSQKEAAGQVDFTKGLYYQMAIMPRKAQDSFRATISSPYKPEEARLRLANALIWAGDYEEARIVLNKITKIWSSINANVALANLDLLEDNFDSLDLHTDAAEKACKTRRPYFLWLRASLCSRKGDLENAKQYFEEGTELFKQENPGVPLPKDYKLYGGILKLFRNKPAEAVLDLTFPFEVWKRHPDKQEFSTLLLWRYFAAISSEQNEIAEQTMKELYPFLQRSPYLQDLFEKYKPTFAKSSSNPIASRDRPVEKIWVVAIGVCRFKDPRVATLKFSAKDANDFAEFIHRQGVPSNQIKILANENATRLNILDTIGDHWLPSNCGENDVVIIYVSTHGTPSSMDPGSASYVVPYDVDSARLYSSAISMNSFTELIGKRLKTDRIALILDTCYSGGLGLEESAFGNVSSKKLADLSGQIVICSSDVKERSWESRRTTNGVFTYRLLQILNSPTGGTFTEKFKIVSEDVRKEVVEDFKTSQRPQMSGRWGRCDLLELLFKDIKK